MPLKSTCRHTCPEACMNFTQQAFVEYHRGMPHPCECYGNRQRGKDLTVLPPRNFQSGRSIALPPAPRSLPAGCQSPVYEPHI